MPELPEVETIRQDLSQGILRKQIKKVEVKDSKVVEGAKGVWQKKLLGNKFVETKRIGKLLALVLKNNVYLLIHLKMTGQLVYQKKNRLIAGGHPFSTKDETKAIGGELPNKFTKLIITFSDNSQLFFNDMRRFGYARLVSKLNWNRTRDKFGPEPLTDDFKLPDFRKSLNFRRGTIKAVLLNQGIIAGLGNIYVDESLFLSKIDPRRKANTLSSIEIKRLFANIEKVLRSAIKFRGTTFSDYVDNKGKRGNFSQKLRVYGQQGRKCVECQNLIKKIKVAGRGTHICEICQK